MPLSEHEIRELHQVKPAGRLTYHAPSEAGIERHAAIAGVVSEAMGTIEDICQDSREKSLAMTKLEEAKFWASAAVARNPETR